MGRTSLKNKFIVKKKIKDEHFKLFIYAIWFEDFISQESQILADFEK